MSMQNIEMVPCSRCGKMYPKKRKDLGYNYCVQCSTEKPYSCRVESYGQGDHTYTELSVIPQEVAEADIKVTRHHRAIMDHLLAEDLEVDMSTFEMQEEVSASLAQEFYKDAQLEEIEELKGYSEVTLEEFAGVDEFDSAEFPVAREPRDAEVDEYPEEDSSWTHLR